MRQASFWSDMQLSKLVIILVSGYIDSGKSLLSENMKNLILDKNFKVTIKSFATAVKECARKYFGWNGIKDEKGRQLLQDIGMFGRDYNPDIWVNKLKNEILESYGNVDAIIIDDWRFENEYNSLSSEFVFEVFTVHVFRPDNFGSTHRSETGLEDFKNYDYVIINSSKESLKDSAKKIVNEIFGG